MKSGMLAAEAAADALLAGREGGDELSAYEEGFKNSWLYDELYKSRNFGAAIHKWGAIKGGAFNFIDQNIFGGKIPFTLHDTKPDYACLKPAAESKKIEYPKPDGKLSFDKLSSVFLSTPTMRKTSRFTSADRPKHPDRQEPAAVRRAGSALPPGRRLRSGQQRRWQQALPDQRAELRALQDLRHQGPGAEHHPGRAGRYRRAELPQHVSNEKAPSGAFLCR